MFSTQLRNATLSTTRPTATRLAARRVGRTRIAQRFQTTASTSGPAPSGSSATTHAAAGVAGGAVVLLGVYGFYHFSGAKKAVDGAKAASTYYQQTKSAIVEKAPKNPNEALQFLRSIAKSYAGIIPGASTYVDSTFDSLDELHDTHGDELNKILQGAYDEIQGVLKDVKNQDGAGVDAATAVKLMSILRKRVGELNELGKKAGSDVFSKLEEKYPTVAQSIGSSYGDLKNLAQRGGPEAKELVDESISQVQDLLKNSKNPQDAWAKATDLVQSKSQKVKELVWDKVAEEAKEHPELVKIMEENRQTFVSQGVNVRSLKEVLERVRAAAKEGSLDDGKLKELKDFVKTKSQETSSQGWQEWIKNVPGGNQALKKMSNVDVQSLVELSMNKSGDAKQLAEETYRDILKVLQEKSDKASKLAKDTAEEAKSKSS
ncbi:hypothetical protein BDW22DRAFT_1484995 [Trametopsis cervina]|nr:hypothetical protein BDW22DRAFT_1484995 [Trametopsis cervina]